MNTHHTMHIKAFNGHGVLPRVLMGFSRRRVRIQALQFFDVFDGRLAELQVDFECDQKLLADLVKQLGKVVEVENVRVESRAEERPQPAAAA